MLVLSREHNEEITIDIPEGFSGKIKVAYLGQLRRQVGGRTINEARIGFQAPKEVVIVRSELENESNAKRIG